MRPAQKRLEFLDSVRGRAALAVLLSHVLGAFNWADQFLLRALLNPFSGILVEGKAAVAMFFVLSGYVLSRPYVMTTSEFEQNASVRKVNLPSFYVKRLIRIWPPWFAVFCLSILAKQFLLNRCATQPPASDWLISLWIHPLTAPGFLRQCIFNEHDASLQLLNQDWSLGVELKGSLLIPLFIFLSQGKRFPMLIPVACAFYYLLPTGDYYISFILGVCLARFGEEGSWLWSKLNALGKVLLFMAGLALYQSAHILQVYSPDFYSFKHYWNLISLGCCCVLTCCLNSGFLQHQLHRRLMVFLGRISYSLYLVQFIIILCVLPPLMAALNTMGFHSRPGVMITIFLTAILGTIALAELVYRFVEVPTMAFGRFVAKRLEQQDK